MTLRRTLVVALLAVLVGTVSAHAQEMRFFRIGTGGIAGTYYPIGGLIADIICSPPGARPCDKGGSCGVPGLVAIAQSARTARSPTSTASSRAIWRAASSSRTSPTGRYNGTGIFEGKGKVDNLRAIASLYPETIHIVPRKGAGISSVRDLKGKRVSLDEPGSGTLVDARIILQAFGLSEATSKPEYIKSRPGGRQDPGQSARRLRHRRRLSDRFGGRARLQRRLRPGAGRRRRRSTRSSQKYQFFAKDVIPGRHLRGHRRDRRPSASAPSGWSAPRSTKSWSTASPRRSGTKTARAARPRPRQRASRSSWPPRSTASAFPCTPAPSATTGRPACCISLLVDRQTAARRSRSRPAPSALAP